MGTPAACMRAQSLQLCPTLCDPMDYSPSGSSVHGILQARILEWIAMPSSRDFPEPGIKPMFLMSLALVGVLFTTFTTWEAQEVPEWGFSMLYISVSTSVLWMF